MRATLLARDPLLPQRDLLLDGARMGRLLERKLGLTGPLAVERCDVVRVKYRVRESLRVRYRLDVEGRRYDVACRAFAPGRAEPAYRRALERSVPAGPLRPVAWEPRMDSVFWAFPNDRKLAVDLVTSQLAQLLGSPPRHCRLVAYAPEKSATVRCDSALNGPLAYVKVYAGDDAARSLAVHERLSPAPIRTPRVVAWSRLLRALAVEPLPGRPLAELPSSELDEGYRLLGEALGRLHDVPPPDAQRFRRFDLDCLHRAADLVGLARPDAGAAVTVLLDELERTVAHAAGPPVCLHGDVHLKNVLFDRGDVALVDLDQVAAGPAASDLGSVLAGLRYARLVEGLQPELEQARTAALLGGYARVRTLPARDALNWHTAAGLLAERALRAVNRVRADGLARLVPLLDDARTILHA